MSGDASGGSSTPQNPFPSAGGGGSRRPPIWLLVVIAVVVIGVIVAAVVYATSGRGGPTSSPTPSPSATPTQTPSPTPDPSAAKAAKAAKDHADAEYAVKAALAETYRMGNHGEVDATPELKKYLAGNELKSVLAGLRDIRQEGYQGHGAPKIGRVVFRTKFPEAVQTLQVCELPNGFYSTDKNGNRIASGQAISTYTVTVSLVGDQWRQTRSNNTKEIKSCAQI